MCLAAARCLRLLLCLSDSLAVPGACLLLLPLHFRARCQRLYFVGSMSQKCRSVSVRQGFGVPKEAVCAQEFGAGEHHTRHLFRSFVQHLVLL